MSLLLLFRSSRSARAIRGTDFVPSPAQVRAYWRRLKFVAAEDEKKKARARLLEKRLQEALKWAYLDATDPEKAAELRAALAASAPYTEPDEVIQARNELESQWYALQESIEATEHFVGQIEEMQHRARMRAREQDDIEILLLAESA